MTANPKLSPDGRHVLSHGNWELWMDGERLSNRGVHPGWLANDRMGYLSEPDGFLTDSGGARLCPVPFNTVAMGSSQWIGAYTAERQCYTSRDDVIQDAYCPAISPNGSKWACLTGNTSLSHGLLVNGVELFRGEIDDKLSISNRGVVAFSVFEGGLQQTYVYWQGQVRRSNATWQRYEVDPVVVDVGNETWLISHDDTRTLVRPVDSTVGYAFAGAKTPHAAWTGSRLRVVGDLENRLLDVSLDLSAPRIDLSQGGEQPIIIEPITRPCWAGWFKIGSQFDASGAWRSQPSSWAHCEDVPPALQAIDEGLAVVCSVDVALSTPSVLANCAAIWCQGPQGQGGDVDAVGRECRRAIALLAEDDRPTRPPILAYVDDAQLAGFQTSADWIALQLYCADDESPEQALQRFRRAIANAPDKPLVLVVQAWDRRTTADGQGQPIEKVNALQALWPRLVNEDTRIVGVLAFAWGRAGGGITHPSLARLQAEIASSIPGVPELVRIRDEEPEEPPEEEPVPEKLYDEQFYLNTAAPLQDSDPPGACNQAIADYRVMGREPDHQYPIWFTRTETDYQNKNLSLEVSWKIHRNEMRAMLDPSGVKLPPFL